MLEFLFWLFHHSPTSLSPLTHLSFITHPSLIHHSFITHPSLLITSHHFSSLHITQHLSSLITLLSFCHIIQQSHMTLSFSSTLIHSHPLSHTHTSTHAHPHYHTQSQSQSQSHTITLSHSHTQTYCLLNQHTQRLWVNMGEHG